MLGFDTTAGFWLLALVPLLWLLQRRKARPRRVVLSVFPVVAALLELPRKRQPLWLRLVRRLRQVFNTLAVVLLALAFNGMRLHLTRPEPGEWLVVVDNPYTLGAVVEGRQVAGEARRGLEAFADRLASSDRLRLVVTCPEPRLIRVPEDLNLDEAMAAAVPTVPAPEPDALLAAVEALAAGRRLRGRLVLSPRADLWRAALERQGLSGAYLVPPDAARTAGNAGITAFDLRASPRTEGVYTLFFEVSSAGPVPGSVAAALTAGGRRVEARTVRLGPGGRAREVWVDLSLPPGPVTLALQGGDALPDDDRVAAVVGGTRRVTAVPRGPLPLFLREALEAHEGFAVAAGASAPEPAVDVFSGAPPEALTRPALVVAPTKAFLGFGYRRTVEQPGQASFHPVHPLTRALRFASFRPSRVVDFSVPEGFSVLASAAGAPVIAIGTYQGHRVAVWNFEPADRGLFLDPSFPILARETLDWLAGQGDVGWTVGRGEPGTPNLLSREATAQAASITLPDLRALPYGAPAGRTRVPLDLTPWLLLAALPVLALAALGAAVPSEGE